MILAEDIIIILAPSTIPFVSFSNIVISDRIQQLKKLLLSEYFM
jgi:hypothetical protein